MARRPVPLNLYDLRLACILEATKRVDESQTAPGQTLTQARAGWVSIALSTAVSGNHAATALGIPRNRIYQHRYRLENLRADAEAFARTLRPVWKPEKKQQSERAA